METPNKTASGRKLQVWCLLRDQFGHVKPVEDFFGERAVFAYDSSWAPDRMLAAAPDVVLCVNDVSYDVSRCLDAARGAGIPSVVLQDGILEWRCQYENPRLGAGGGAPQHQPVLADKIACIGPSSARHLGSWGNAEKVEVTGMPRLDSLLARTPAGRRRPGARLLVMTAKKPGFNQDQTKLTVQSLLDLRTHLDSLDGVQVTWRLTKDLAVRIGVENSLTELGGSELTQQLAEADAVITTPSTAMLEAMIAGRPVACLDYHNVPRFVPTAWSIPAREHIPSIVADLLAPPSAKMAFQDECLCDALVCDGSATRRVARLIDSMAAKGRRGRVSGTTLDRTVRPAPPEKARATSPFPSLWDLFPQAAVFQEHDVRSLQARLARAESENLQLKRKLSGRGVGYWVQVAGRATARHLKAKANGGSA